MAKNTRVILGEHFDSFVAKQIKSGRYSSASEVIRAGLMTLEDSENKLSALRQMLSDGEKSGTTDYSYDSFIAEQDITNN